MTGPGCCTTPPVRRILGARPGHTAEGGLSHRATGNPIETGGSTVTHSDSSTASPFDPGRRAPIKREIAEKIGYSWLERTRGKGQGLKWRRGQSDQSKPYPYFSGDYKQSMPNGPGALLKEVMKAKGIVTAEQKSVPYWEEHFDEQTDLLETWLEKEHTARSAAPPVE